MPWNLIVSNIGGGSWEDQQSIQKKNQIIAEACSDIQCTNLFSFQCMLIHAYK